MRFLALVALCRPGRAASLAQPEARSGTAEALRDLRGATEPKAVFELFTSQGCSSCPAADALLGKLAKRDDVIALSLPVDYWDYLGWKDTLASPKFTERQRAYAKALGDGMVYTPQAVVNGLTHVNGSDQDKIERAIDKTPRCSRPPARAHQSDGGQGRLSSRRARRRRACRPRRPRCGLRRSPASVEVPITRGENQGRTIIYSNVVRELMPIGMWNGKAMTVQLDRHSFMRPGADRCAVLLQQGKAGPIVGAALLRQC